MRSHINQCRCTEWPRENHGSCELSLGSCSPKWCINYGAEYTRNVIFDGQPRVYHYRMATIIFHGGDHRKCVDCCWLWKHCLFLGLGGVSAFVQTYVQTYSIRVYGIDLIKNNAQKIDWNQLASQSVFVCICWVDLWCVDYNYLADLMVDLICTRCVVVIIC